jgi:hypothetical protein
MLYGPAASAAGDYARLTKIVAENAPKYRLIFMNVAPLKK